LAEAGGGGVLDGGQVHDPVTRPRLVWQDEGERGDVAWGASLSMPKTARSAGSELLGGVSGVRRVGPVGRSVPPQRPRASPSHPGSRTAGCLEFNTSAYDRGGDSRGRRARRRGPAWPPRTSPGAYSHRGGSSDGGAGRRWSEGRGSP
jgi:hypothetical protein